jgi:hypothetical protein
VVLRVVVVRLAVMPGGWWLAAAALAAAAAVAFKCRCLLPLPSLLLEEIEFKPDDVRNDE